MKSCTTAVAAAVLALCVSVSAHAQNAFQVVPFVYNPVNACDVRAMWQDGAVFLAKNCLTTTEAAAGVDIITPLEGQDISTLTELNFDYQNGGHCGAGAPRFNIVLAGQPQPYFLGCQGGTRTDLGNGWTHVEFGPTDFAAAGIPTTGIIEDIYIIFDEGTDTPPSDTIGTPGQVTLDNFSVNNDVVGSSTVPTSKDECKNGGWTNFQDPSFKNQGQCVSYVVSHRPGARRRP
jgi:hypothetical protein